MVLTKDEFISAVNEEVRLLLHLISKVEPQMLEFQPTPQTRTLLQVLQYLTLFPGLHLRSTLAPVFSMEGWMKAYQVEEPLAKGRNLDQIKEAIAAQPAMAAELLRDYPDAELRADFNMFGESASRGVWLVRMILSHYAAYRMQVFVYLKSCGRPELNTMNLWAGTDGSMEPPPSA